MHSSKPPQQPAAPPPPPAPPTTDQAQADVDASVRARQRKGRASDILAQGDSAPMGVAKRLLG